MEENIDLCLAAMCKSPLREAAAYRNYLPLSFIACSPSVNCLKLDKIAREITSPTASSNLKMSTAVVDETSEVSVVWQSLENNAKFEDEKILPKQRALLGGFEGNIELCNNRFMDRKTRALILSQDHKEYLRLGNGFVIDIDLKGAVSFDLSGKIELSIWNRNAQSLIKKSVGYVSKGSLTLSTPFAQSRLDFLGSLEPKLNLEIDADFSANVKLCMKLSQPDTEFRHQVTKLGQIPAANHRLKLALNRRQSIPGVTYALNRKNSEMCSALGS
ncbi:hypothetical protein HUJ05_010708 [Dendroctonus ponderosae]|nr:hypothetical protein HUJ05_010708 [Dendroctonus ponderosae]